MSLITKQELIDNNTKLDKKLILINSSLYEEDAFNYLLELVTNYGAMAFISDTHKIWTQGRYYGGDIFEKDLYYWRSISVLGDDDEIAKEIEISRSRSQLKFKAANNITLGLNKDNVNDPVMTIGYDIDNTVDTEKFTIDNGGIYNLEVKDGKIRMKKYVPISITTNSLPLLEHDSGDATVNLNLTVSGTEAITKLEVTSNHGTVSEYKLTDTSIITQVPNNTATTITINYSDGTTDKTLNVTQDWGYKVIYGSLSCSDELLTVEGKLTEHINLLSKQDKYITKSLTKKVININQPIDKYGWVVMPATWKPVFTDNGTNLQGGWEKYGKITFYSDNINYQVWRTEQSGLGNVQWTITSK